MSLPLHMKLITVWELRNHSMYIPLSFISKEARVLKKDEMTKIWNEKTNLNLI